MRRRASRAAGWLLLASFAVGPLAFGEAAAAKYYAEDIKEAMRVHVAARVDDDEIFHLRDDVTGEMLELKFVKVHDPVRQIDGDTYFACTDFHVVGEPDKLYDLDFWLHPEDGRLVVHDEKVHKEPRHSFLYGWYKQPRYTFVNDEIVSLY
ncbi:MAG TPA: hypothetical protein VLA56_17740 [Pseudomonadales bacterium]|nr:hypothetical protein [Pseudomonadales bacterium]